MLLLSLLLLLSPVWALRAVRRFSLLGSTCVLDTSVSVYVIE